MAVGDTVSYGDDAVTSNGTFDIQPSAGVEVLVQQIEAQSAKAAEVYRTADGTNFTLIDSLPNGGSMTGLYRCTNTFWLRLKNVSGGDAGLYAAGVQTK